MVEGVTASGISSTAALPRDATKSVSGQFAVEDDTAPLQQQTRTAAISGIGLDSLLALQAVDEAAERNRAAHKRSAAMVAALTRLQRAMLAGDDPSQTLNALRELSADGPVADDPSLAAIVRAVVLRSRVEIARREPPVLGRHSI